MIKIRQTQFFLSVFQYNSFVKAAESLNVSLPSVSKDIRELEEILQVKLIKGHTNGIKITEYASFLENYSHLILKGFSNADKEIKRSSAELLFEELILARKEMIKMGLVKNIA